MFMAARFKVAQQTIEEQKSTYFPFLPRLPEVLGDMRQDYEHIDQLKEEDQWVEVSPSENALTWHGRFTIRTWRNWANYREGYWHLCDDDLLALTAARSKRVSVEASPSVGSVSVQSALNARAHSAHKAAPMDSALVMKDDDTPAPSPAPQPQCWRRERGCSGNIRFQGAFQVVATMQLGDLAHSVIVSDFHGQSEQTEGLFTDDCSGQFDGLPWDAGSFQNGVASRIQQRWVSADGLKVGSFSPQPNIFFHYALAQARAASLEQPFMDATITGCMERRRPAAGSEVSEFYMPDPADAGLQEHCQMVTRDHFFRAGPWPARQQLRSDFLLNGSLIVTVDGRQNTSLHLSVAGRNGSEYQLAFQERIERHCSFFDCHLTHKHSLVLSVTFEGRVVGERTRHSDVLLLQPGQPTDIWLTVNEDRKEVSVGSGHTPRSRPLLHLSFDDLRLPPARLPWPGLPNGFLVAGDGAWTLGSGPSWNAAQFAGLNGEEPRPLGNLSSGTLSLGVQLGEDTDVSLLTSSGASYKVGLQMAQSRPSWVRFVPPFLRPPPKVVFKLSLAVLCGKRVMGKTETPVGQSPPTQFWLAIDDRAQRVSLITLINDQQQLLLSLSDQDLLQSPNGCKPPPAPSALWPGKPSHFAALGRQSDMWMLQHTARECSMGLPEDANPRHLRSLRVPTVLLQSFLWAGAGRFEAATAAQHWQRLDANLSNRVHIEGDPLLALAWNRTAGAEEMTLNITSPRVSSHCSTSDGQGKVLLDAQTDFISSHAAVNMLAEKDGGLSMAIQFVSNQSHLSAPHPILLQPSVPILRRTVHHLLRFFMPLINKELQNRSFQVPPWIGHFMPCPGGMCKTVLNQTGGYAFVEVHTDAATTVDLSEPQYGEGLGPLLPSGETLRNYKRAITSFASRWRCYILCSVVVCLVLVVQCWPKLASLPHAALLASAPVSACQSLCWLYFNPWESFSNGTLTLLGIVVEDALSQDSCLFECWWIWAVVSTFCLALLFLVVWAALVVLRCTTHWDTRRGSHDLLDTIETLTSTMAFTSIFYLLVGLPLSTVVAKMLEASAGEGSGAMVALLLQQAGAADIVDTAKRGSFTSIFVAYSGVHFMYFLMAVPVGLFGSCIVFAHTHWNQRHCGGASHMAVVLLVLAESIASTAMLGPFVIIYQILSGTYKWWAIAGAMSLLRPLVVLPGIRMVFDQATPPTFAMLFFTLFHATLSLGGAVWLYQLIEGALRTITLSHQPGEERQLLHIQPLFLAITYLSTAFFVAIGSFSAMAAQRREDDRHTLFWFIMEKLLTRLQGFLCKLNCKCLFELLGSLVSTYLLDFWRKSEPWIIAILEIDAVSTFLYHLFKLWVLACPNNGLPGLERTLPAGTVSFLDHLGNVWQAVGMWWEGDDWAAFLARQPRVHQESPGGPIPMTWAVPVFLLLCVVAHFALRAVRVARPQGCCRRASPRSRSSSSVQPRPDAGLHQPLLAAEDVEVAPAEDEDRGGPSGIDTAQQPDRRLEFILVGLAHWFCLIVRSFMDRDTWPHTYGVANPVADNAALQHFRTILVSKFNLSVDVNRPTLLDTAFLSFDRLVEVVLLLQLLPFAVLALAGVLHSHYLTASQICMLLCAGLVLSCTLLPLLPNYSSAMDLGSFVSGCGPEFEVYVNFMVNGFLGSGFAAYLGVRLMSLLLTLPVTLVRGVWLLLVDRKSGLLHNQNSVDILETLMQLLSACIPFLVVFPLLFYVQLTEDEASLQPLLVFWLLPSLFLALSRDHYNSSHFYILWLLLYLACFVHFLWRQLEVLKLDFVRDVLEKADWPWLWSAMHVDFCVANVMIMDLITLLLEGIPFRPRKDAAPTPLTSEKVSRACLVLGSSSSLEPLGLQSQRTGLVSYIVFQTREEAAAAARGSEQLVLATPSLVPRQ